MSLREQQQEPTLYLEHLDPGLVFLLGCPAPHDDPELCRKLGEAGVRSLLEVGDFESPFARRTYSGIWCFRLPTASASVLSRQERQTIRDFVGYERAHDRQVALWTQSNAIRFLVIAEARAATGRQGRDGRELTSEGGTRCCSQYYPSGCSGVLVCHATPVESAARILDSGNIMSKHRLSGVAVEDLALYSTWGEPPDYFDYVMLSNGNCTAPDAVAASRVLGRDLTPEDLDPEEFYPGVRFFFDPAVLSQHPRAVWDGVHMLKVKSRIELGPYLTAIVAPARLPNRLPLTLYVPPKLRERIVYLDYARYDSPAAWADATLHAALEVANRQGEEEGQ